MKTDEKQAQAVILSTKDLTKVFGIGGNKTYRR